LRPTDVLARYGGEEFGLLLSCTVAPARTIVDRLRAVMPQGVTCSVGLAEWDRHEAAETLVERADRALYTAKEQGRDRVISAPTPLYAGPDRSAMTTKVPSDAGATI
jgi:diguanylate cyclase (GGDEF)-like protein